MFFFLQFLLKFFSAVSSEVSVVDVLSNLPVSLCLILIDHNNFYVVQPFHPKPLCLPYVRVKNSKLQTKLQENTITTI